MPLITIIPNVISYSASISACEKGAMWQAALALFHKLPKAKIHPNLHAQNATISACEKATQWQQALAIFHSAEVSPDVVTCRCLRGMGSCSIFLSPEVGSCCIEWQWGTPIRVYPKMPPTQCSHWKKASIISSWLYLSIYIYIYILSLSLCIYIYRFSTLAIIFPFGISAMVDFIPLFLLTTIWPAGMVETRPRWPTVQWWVHVRRERSGNPHCPCCKSGETPSPEGLTAIICNPLRYPQRLLGTNSQYQSITKRSTLWCNSSDSIRRACRCLQLWGKPFAAVAQVTGNKPGVNATCAILESKFSNKFLLGERRVCKFGYVMLRPKCGDTNGYILMFSIAVAQQGAFRFPNILQTWEHHEEWWNGWKNMKERSRALNSTRNWYMILRIIILTVLMYRMFSNDKSESHSESQQLNTYVTANSWGLPYFDLTLMLKPCVPVAAL